VNVLRSPAYVYGRTLFNNALLRTLTRYRRRLDTSSRARARARQRERGSYPCTPFDVVTSERGVAAGWYPASPVPAFPFHLSVRSRSLVPFSFLSLFLPLAFSIALRSPCSSTFAFPLASLFCVVVCRFAHAAGRTRARTRSCAHVHTRATPCIRHTHAVCVSSGLYISGLRA